ncbi:DNA cross-link repair protein [Saccharomycopsis crataegensis]|uniref:DNA cross-link repair protein n=1 Tax=Saccharomycopsis crataegensis TaxID=43959 RepID=A0AAV5QVA8_9ASCO|nr:DNA cross-link repair protein [Saccharomycopsis crataegensis]
MNVGEPEVIDLLSSDEECSVSKEKSDTAPIIIEKNPRNAKVVKVERDELEKPKKKKRERKPIPILKILTFENVKGHKFSVSVDAFNYKKHDSIDHYFLSHFHADHYYGITKGWNNGEIYCSEITANLLALKYKINPSIIHPLKLNVTYELVDNLFITLIDANHCPGAAIILFEYITNMKKKSNIKEEDNLYENNYHDMQEDEIWELLEREKFGIEENNILNESSNLNNRRFIRACENCGIKVFRILHTGDFRVCKTIICNSLIANHKIDKLYLDTTYFDPRYTFPDQDLVVKQFAEFVVELVYGVFFQNLAESNGKGDSTLLYFQKRITDFFTEKPKEPPKTKRKTKSKAGSYENEFLGPSTGFNKFKYNYLICIGTYTIGKEKIAIELAKKLNLKIYANGAKREIFNTFTDSDHSSFRDLIIDDPFATNIHLVPMRSISSPALLEAYYKPLRLTYKNIIGIRPTGWTLRSKPSFTAHELRTLTNEEILAATVNNDKVHSFGIDDFYAQFNASKVLQIYNIPYSEHSSFRELCMFIILLNVQQVIPTVNLHNLESIRRMEQWVSICKKMKEEKHYSIEDF